MLISDLSFSLMVTMENLSIRLFEEKDINFAYKMNVREQWNDRKDDIKRMFDYEPNGSFIVEVKDSPVGHVFAISYGKLGWIGLLIVKAEYRKKGVGTLLTKKAVDYLLHCGVETIKLEAVPQISNLYRKLGFVDEFDSLRFKRACGKIISKCSDSLALIEKKSIIKIAEFDAGYFGAERTSVLVSLYQENPKLCFVSYEGSEVAGYIMCRGAKSGYTLGPFVCNPENPQAAKELLARCIQKLGVSKTLYVGVPALNKKGTEILREFGFEQYSKSIRMRLGKNIKNEKPNGIFAIGGPMKG